MVYDAADDAVPDCDPSELSANSEFDAAFVCVGALRLVDDPAIPSFNADDDELISVHPP